MRPSLLVVFAVAGLAATAPAALAAAPPPAAKVVGEDVGCVNIRSIRQTRVRDDQTIDFVMNDSKVYRNTLPNRCPQLGFERAFGYATSQMQLCNVDIITVLIQAGGIRRGASCGLGKFTPVELLPKPKR
jgi:hypothetical protein